MAEIVDLQGRRALEEKRLFNARSQELHAAMPLVLQSRTQCLLKRAEAALKRAEAKSGRQEVPA